MTPGERLWLDKDARDEIIDALGDSARAVRNSSEYNKNREQGSFIIENPDGSFDHTKPDPYAPQGNNMEGTAFGPPRPIPPPEGTRAIALALPKMWYHDSIAGGIGPSLSERSKDLGFPLFGITTGRDSGRVYLFEPGGWSRLK